MWSGIRTDRPRCRPEKLLGYEIWFCVRVRPSFLQFRRRFLPLHRYVKDRTNGRREQAIHICSVCRSVGRSVVGYNAIITFLLLVLSHYSMWNVCRIGIPFLHYACLELQPSWLRSVQSYMVWCIRSYIGNGNSNGTSHHILCKLYTLSYTPPYTINWPYSLCTSITSP